MAEYGLDIDPYQIVRWLGTERKAGRGDRFDVRATREYSAEPLADPAEAGIDDDQDVASLTTIGTLEVRPTGGGPRWTLRVRIEDVVGSHLPDDESVPEDAEEIDLDAFEADFIAPDSGTAYVSLEAGTAQARQDVDRLLSMKLADRHGR